MMTSLILTIDSLVELYSSSFRRAAAVVRDRGYIPDEADAESGSLQGSESGFSAGARPLYVNFNTAHAMFLGFFCTIFGGNLGSERCALA